MDDMANPQRVVYKVKECLASGLYLLEDKSTGIVYNGGRGVPADDLHPVPKDS